jgi:hypothetical protein
LGHETGKYDFVLFQGHFYTEAVAVQNTEFWGAQMWYI